MSVFNSVSMVSLGLLLLVLAVVVVVPLLRALRRRGRSSRRTVERPNSHYTSPLVHERETRHRWQDMALDRVHEINREEVVRLLAKVEAGSVEALSEKERVFLDHMAKLAGRSPGGEPRERGKPIVPDLRHRPA